MGLSEMLKLYVQVLHVLGKALSDELSCMQTGVVCNTFYL